MAGPRRFLLSLFLALGLALGPSPGRDGALAAEDGDVRKARAQYDIGVRHYNVGRYREALVNVRERADAIASAIWG